MSTPLGKMTPEQRRAAVKRACQKVQAELNQPHVKAAIEKALNDFDAQHAPESKPAASKESWPEGYWLDPSGRMCIPEGKAVDWHFGYDIGFAEAWEIINRAVAVTTPARAVAKATGEAK